MSTQIILNVLALRQRDRWTRHQLEEHQGRALHLLREHAYAPRSLFYGRFHKGITDCPLNEMPVLDGQFKNVVSMATDPVCGMAVEREKVIVAEWNGRTFYVCSRGRRNEFFEDPGRYTDSDDV